MDIKSSFPSALLMACLASAAAAEVDHKAEHGGQIFHAFELETDYGAGRNPMATWDMDGWIGTDDHKLALKSEGEVVDGATEQAEIWAMYSRNISAFWDAQIGVRHDMQPLSTSYMVAGFEGLAPFFVETEAHLFLSDEGDVSARVRQERDFLIMQRLISQPYWEAEFYGQDVEELGIGAGLSHAEIGLQTRYEISRKFMPYIDFRYERLFGETSSNIKKNGGENDDFIASFGVKLLF